ncbi:DUF6879 family protein [Kitasatospora sp. NPDC053057]|uniref:DUF6879 family protein n=1 Tax=Kitasatospora sp. NPDC053057 TaxID=3364062 RepID=UPI0037CBA4CE
MALLDITSRATGYREAVMHDPVSRSGWFPRSRAFDLALPGTDFWLFDSRIVRFSLFTGDGEWADPRRVLTWTSVRAARAFGALGAS